MKINVLAAAERIAGQIVRTPLIEARIAGRRVWLKCECLQTGGAFKLRGATNRLMLLDEAERARGHPGAARPATDGCHSAVYGTGRP